VNEVLTMHMGPDFVLLNMSVDFRDSITADEVERAISVMDRNIKQQFPQVKRIFIEAEKRSPSNV
jgi:divalent metal cation (Fe/Co/Zn/Cd) transporter